MRVPKIILVLAGVFLLWAMFKSGDDCRAHGGTEREVGRHGMTVCD